MTWLNRRTVLLAGGAFLTAGRTMAQDWPARQPLRFIVPFPAGQGVDSLARVLADKVGRSLGQAVITDNRPGAGSMIGSEMAAKARPDGYTFLIGGSSALSINPHLYRKLAYDPVADFEAVSVLATFPYVYCVHPDLPARSISELKRLAAKQHGRLTYATSGPGSTAQIVSALLMKSAQIDMLEVPYKGAAQILPDVVAGRVGMVADVVTTLHALITAGKLRPIAVSTSRRVSSLPDVATVEEQGFKSFDVSAWAGVVAPAGTPPEILDRMNVELAKAMAAPEVRSQLQKLYLEPVSVSHVGARDYIGNELLRWGNRVKSTGVKLE